MQQQQQEQQQQQQPRQAWLTPFLARWREAEDRSQSLEGLFLEAVAQKQIELYKAQREAIKEVFGDCHVVLSTPTGSGKSLVATAMLFRAIGEAQRAYYTCPIKALVGEKFFSLCKDFGPELVGMATGDVSINSQAPIICCTAEVLANVALREGSASPLKFVVMDEFHYFSDKTRGFAWELPLLRLPQATFLLMSATMGDNPRLHSTLAAITNRQVRVVTSSERPVPLDWSFLPSTVLEAVSDLTTSGRSPVYVVSFTQNDAAKLAKTLVGAKGLERTDEEKLELKAAMEHVPFDSPYGPHVRSLLINGIGLHHAGLLPKYRLLVEQLAQAGKLTCICGTDTLGVGVNIPIRSVLFTQLCKFNGEETVLLSARDFHQIAGRAGRRGFDTQGSVVSVPATHQVNNSRLEQKIAAEPSQRVRQKLKKRFQSAPTKNYREWSEATFQALSESSPEPLRSQFQLNQGHVLSILQGAQEHGRDGDLELRELVAWAQCSEEMKQYWSEQVTSYIGALTNAGLVSQAGSEHGDVRVDEGLQRDFLLMEDASLFLIDVLPLLQWSFSGKDVDYAKAVLGVVEAVCEDPRPILRAQRRMKGHRPARIPCEDVVLPAFDNFWKKHPWVAADALKPKALALEMYEHHLSFKDFIDKLGKADKFKVAMRQEGLLLRYLTLVHKTLRHNVPEEFKTDAVLEIEAFLLAVINATDSSLLQEWARLKALETAENLSPAAAGAALALPLADADSTEGQSAEALGQPPESELDWRILMARVRVEAEQLARKLAHGQWDQAALMLRCSEGNADKEQLLASRGWDKESLRAEVVVGDRRPLAPESDVHVHAELEEDAEGWIALIEVYREQDEASAWLELEVFAPWPGNSFEPLLELQSVR